MGVIVEFDELEIIDMVVMTRTEILKTLLRKLKYYKDQTDTTDASSSSSTPASSSRPKRFKDQDGKIHHKGGSKKADAVVVEYAVDEALKRSAGEAEKQWLKKRNTKTADD